MKPIYKSDNFEVYDFYCNCNNENHVLTVRCDYLTKSSLSLELINSDEPGILTRMKNVLNYLFSGREYWDEFSIKDNDVYELINVLIKYERRKCG